MIHKKPKAQAQEFTSDYRKTNPSLHMLYVKTACRHLAMLDQTIQRFVMEANLNLHDSMGALIEERQKLVQTSAAHADADEILQDLYSNRILKVKTPFKFYPSMEVLDVESK